MSDLLQHDLAHEFPTHVEKMHEMKLNNAHFAKLCTKYDDVNKQIIALEGKGTPVADESMEDLKKQRMTTKDEIYKMLKA
jgi:uncharacterized protein YdcH (DUF465 family)